MIFCRLAVPKLLVIAVVSIVISRIALAVITIYHPIPNEHGLKASINHPAPSSDLHHYQNQSKLYFEAGIVEILKVVALEYYDADLVVGDETWKFVAPNNLQLSPPMFPTLIWVLDYREGNTLPLALVFIGIGIAVAIPWVKWMARQGMSASWILLFVFLPHPGWFMINLGSDLLFYATFTIFFFVYFSDIEQKKRFILSFLAMTLCIMARPTGVSILLFLLVDQFLKVPSTGRKKKYIHLGLAFLVMCPLLIMLAPYFLSVVLHSGAWPFFGITQPEYLAGIYNDLPQFLDIPLSWLTLFAGKIVYVFGLRPSYGDVSVPVFLLRSMPGLIFLPGFIHLMMRGTMSEKILVLSILAPVFAGPAQDRYLLPLQPILFYHAWLFSRPLRECVSNQLTTTIFRLFRKHTS
jgi:hypothetical protein